MSMIRRRLLMQQEYVQINYIENTPTAYIDTGVIPDYSYRVDCKFQYVRPEFEQHIFGSRLTVSSNRYECTGFNAQNFYSNKFRFSVGGVDTLVNRDELVHTFSMSSEGIIYDGKIIQGRTGVGQCLFTIYIFASNYNNKATVSDSGGVRNSGV